MKKHYTLFVLMLCINLSLLSQVSSFELKTLNSSERLVNDLDFDAESKSIATISASNKVIIWDLATKTPNRVLEVEGGKILKVKFSPDGKYFACKTKKLTHIWETRRWGKMVELNDFWENSPIEFHPTESKIYGASKNKLIIYDFVKARKRAFDVGGRKKGGLITDMQISTDGKKIYTLGKNKEKPIRVYDSWNPSNPKIIELPDYYKNPNQLGFINLSPDGNILSVSLDGNPKVLLFETQNLQSVLNLEMDKPNLSSSFSPISGYLVTASKSRITIDDLLTNDRIFHQNGNMDLAVNNAGNGIQIDVSPDEKYIAGITNSGSLKIWDLSENINNKKSATPKKYDLVIEKLELPDFLFANSGTNENASFSSENWKEYFKQRNYHAITSSIKDQKISNSSDEAQGGFYFFVVVESKYNLAFTNPFELKKGDDGKFLVSDKVLKKELSARGYKRFWLVGNFDDGESTIDFQNLLREVFQKNGLVSEDQIKFEAEQYFDVVTQVSREIETVSLDKKDQEPIVKSKTEIKKTEKPVKVKDQTVAKSSSKTATKKVEEVKEPTIAKSPSKTMTKKVEEVNKKETAKVKKEEKVATVPKTKMEKKEADKKVIKRPALKKSSQKKKPDPLVDYLNSKGLAVNGEEVDEEAILNYNKQKGQSILFSLLEEGNPKVMKKILTKKVSSKFINETNDDQKTILHLACEKGNYQLVDYILYRSPNVNAQDTRGWTPLHYAISSGNTKIVKLLKRHKANPSIKNKGGNNAIKFAKKFGTREMVSILRK